jgi:uncharacterized protein (DUF1800 family)
MPSLSWNRKRAAHLYRRAGFGGLPEELDRAVAMGREAAVDYLVHFEPIPTTDLDARLVPYESDYSVYPTDAEREQLFSQMLRWWGVRMTFTPRQLEEKMTLFWHGHFATSDAKLNSPRLLYDQNQVFRTMGMGHFDDLLLAVSKDPAMLLWLDNAFNNKDAPNENFARELMELFTLGRNQYTQKDVTEAARALTGWTITGQNDVTFQFTFDPSIHDDGVKTFLGSSARYRGEDICAIVAARPETASFVTRKLARFFLGHDPAPALTRRLVDVFDASRGEIRVIVREILLSDDFEQASDHPDLIKSPTEFIVGALRSLGAQNQGDLLLNVGPSLGQFLFVPPNVGGWKGGRDWINTGGYLLRMLVALGVLTNPYGFNYDLNRIFKDKSFQHADELIDFLVDRLNMVEPSDTLRAALHAYLGGMAQFHWDSSAIWRWGLGAMHLLMVSPEYQLQ